MLGPSGVSPQRLTLLPPFLSLRHPHGNLRRISLRERGCNPIVSDESAWLSPLPCAIVGPFALALSLWRYLFVTTLRVGILGLCWLSLRCQLPTWTPRTASELPMPDRAGGRTRGRRVARAPRDHRFLRTSGSAQARTPACDHTETP